MQLVHIIWLDVLFSMEQVLQAKRSFIAFSIIPSILEIAPSCWLGLNSKFKGLGAGGVYALGYACLKSI